MLHICTRKRKRKKTTNLILQFHSRQKVSLQGLLFIFLHIGTNQIIARQLQLLLFSLTLPSYCWINEKRKFRKTFDFFNLFIFAESSSKYQSIVSIRSN